ncbi:hypothetical protein ACWDSJ_28355 [Nocardia sp. NPDC003482]
MTPPTNHGEPAATNDDSGDTPPPDRTSTRQSDHHHAARSGTEGRPSPLTPAPAGRAESEKTMGIFIVGRDDTGQIACTADGIAFYVTDCCGVSATGCDGYVGCRACYQEVNPALGGIPGEEWHAPHRREAHRRHLEWQREMVRAFMSRPTNHGVRAAFTTDDDGWNPPDWRRARTAAALRAECEAQATGPLPGDVVRGPGESLTRLAQLDGVLVALPIPSQDETAFALTETGDVECTEFFELGDGQIIDPADVRPTGEISVQYTGFSTGPDPLDPLGLRFLWLPARVWTLDPTRIAPHTPR